MAEPRTRAFGWQGIRLSVPRDWELGRVDGDAASGYVRLDDAHMVRAEVEWRDAPARGARRPLAEIVDRYLDTLQQKAGKGGMAFRVERRAAFLGDASWLGGSEHETFVWEADYRAYNLARACPGCQRIVLARILTRLDEEATALVNGVLPSLEDHPRPGDRGGTFWSVYGMTFRMLAGFTLSDHDLKSGHIRLTFEKDRGARTLRLHRLSMAQMLLGTQSLALWYPAFFHKDLRDLRHEEIDHSWRGHVGLRVHGRPRSRWRQILRPVPLVNPRPRRYLDGGVWHCPEQNRICVVEHLAKRREAAADGTLEALIEGYVCHPQQDAPVDPRGDVELASGTQRGPDVD